MEIVNRDNLLRLSLPTIQNSLLYDLPINIFLADSLGYLVWGNPRMLKAVGEIEESFEGKHLLSWGYNKWAACQRVIQTGYEESIEEEGPDNRYYLTSRKPIWQKDGNNVVGIIGVSLDITEQKQAELKKQEFIKNVAHDLRTPFTGIVGLAELQAMGKVKPEEIIDYGKMIYTSGNQLLEILNAVIGILDTDQSDNLVRNDRFNLYEFAKEMKALVMPAIHTRQLKFVLRVEENVGLITTDKIRLKQILVNLLSNAVKFTTKGKITLSFEISILENQLKRLIIKVADTGIGIDNKNYERIFEKFEKVKPSYQTPNFIGCGIGLYLVKQLVEDLKGKVTLQSELNKGSIFKIAIPLT